MPFVEKYSKPEGCRVPSPKESHQKKEYGISLQEWRQPREVAVEVGVTEGPAEGSMTLKVEIRSSILQGLLDRPCSRIGTLHVVRTYTLDKTPNDLRFDFRVRPKALNSWIPGSQGRDPILGCY